MDSFIRGLHTEISEMSSFGVVYLFLSIEYKLLIIFRFETLYKIEIEYECNLKKAIILEILIKQRLFCKKIFPYVNKCLYSMCTI